MANLKATLAICFLAMLAIGVAGQASCPCPKILKYVCGSDGTTYQNDCLATCAGATVEYDGQCVAGDKRPLPKCKTTVNCFASPCSVSSASCKGRDDLVCRDNYCAEDTKLDRFTIKGGCSAVYLTKAAGLVVPGCLPGDGCFCPALYSPVCGKDGKTYGNPCEAGCVRVPVAYPGQCKPDCRVIRCGNDVQPVCGVDGKTYKNACQAQCVYNTAIFADGPCASTPAPPNCAAVTCSTDGPEACGADGKTYPNDCVAQCSGVKVAYIGACSAGTPGPSGCAAVLCPATGPQVCGDDGKTYPNECLAKCSGAKVVSTGACKRLCKCPAGPAVCGKDSKTYLNACAAACADVQVAYNGTCTKPKSTNIQCAKNDPGVRCLVNPCSQPNSCKGRPNATCLTFYCSKPVTFQGVKLTKPCSAVYVTKSAGVLIPGCK